MNTRTYLNLRTYYYLGILVLVLYAFPAARKAISPVLDFEVVNGVPIISVLAAAVAIGAYYAYTTRRFG